MSSEKIDGRGLLWGFVSFSMWGFFPVYWKMLSDHGAVEILAHRMIWSFVFYAAIFAIFSYRNLAIFKALSLRDWLLSGAASALLALNWGIYIYAVNQGHILEGSLAYFINPILNVAVGVWLFKEPFPLVLKLSVGFAFLGVVAKILASPGFPWIALTLAITFCVYGITKKILKIPAMASSVLEGAIGFLPALALMAFFESTNAEPTTATSWLLFIGGGVVTGLPLFLFSYAAQRISYSIIGMLQFIAPSLQFVVATAIFNEAFDTHDLVTFGLIWVGMFFYLGHQAFLAQRKFRHLPKEIG